MNDQFITLVTHFFTKEISSFTLSKIGKKFSSYAEKFGKNLNLRGGKSIDDGRGGNWVSKEDAFEDNLNCFEDHEKFFILDDLLSNTHYSADNKSRAKELKIRLHKDYAEHNKLVEDKKDLSFDLTKKTKKDLANYPAVQSLVNSSLEKYNSGNYSRNLLDDMRLALETLLREIFNNKKSLENQISNVGQLSNKSGGSKEFVNMFNKLLDYYCKYQNTYIKHNNAVNKIEKEYVIEYTLTTMRAIIRMHKS